MSQVLIQIIELLVAGIVPLAEGLGAGISSLVTELFVTVTGEGENAVYELTTFGALAVVFAGIALCIGLSRFILSWVTSFGN